jgi:hypothetical protein
MSAVELWDSPQDYIVLAGKKSPGIAEVSDAAAKYDYHIHDAPFATGARMLFKRRELAKFSVRLHLFTREDLAAFDVWRAVIDRKPNADRKDNALTISHPQLADIGISACVVLSVSQLEHDTFGGFYVTIQLMEFKGLPEPSQATVEAAKPVISADPIDAEVITKKNQLQATLEKLSQ